MGGMTTLYLVCLLVGTVVLVIVLMRGSAIRIQVAPRGNAPEDGMTVPGARIEPSDDFAVEGGAGGAEGEGGSPGYDDGADGGVGGAEGGPAGTAVRDPIATASAFFAALLAGFGAIGWATRGAGEALPIAHWVLGLIGGAALGCLAAAYVRSAGR